MRFSGKNDDKTIFAGILEAALHLFGRFSGKAECSWFFWKRNTLRKMLKIVFPPAFNGGRAWLETRPAFTGFALLNPLNPLKS